MWSSIKRKIIQLACLLPLAYMALVLWMVVNERNAVFPGAYKERSDRAPLLPDPYHPVELLTSDGVKLSAFESPPPANPKDPAWCLYCEGQWGRARWDLPKFQLLQGLGLGVLTFDYRGYAESKGTPSEAGLYLDADAAYTYLTKKKGIRPQRILIYGHSLGSGVAIDLGSRVEIGGLIVDGAYTSVPDRGQELYPWLPIAWLAKNRFDSLSKVSRVSAPKLFLHGEFDEDSPWQDGRRVFEQATGDKEWSRFEGGHEDFQWSASTEFQASVTKFVQKHFPNAAATP